MKRRWIAVLGTVLVGFCFTVGCDQGQTTSRPKEIPPLSASPSESATVTPPDEGGATNNQAKP